MEIIQIFFYVAYHNKKNEVQAVVFCIHDKMESKYLIFKLYIFM